MRRLLIFSIFVLPTYCDALECFVVCIYTRTRAARIKFNKFHLILKMVYILAYDLVNITSIKININTPICNL